MYWIIACFALLTVENVHFLQIFDTKIRIKLI